MKNEIPALPFEKHFFFLIFFFLFIELEKVKHYIDFDLLKDPFIRHLKSKQMKD